MHFKAVLMHPYLSLLHSGPHGPVSIFVKDRQQQIIYTPQKEGLHYKSKCETYTWAERLTNMSFKTF